MVKSIKQWSEQSTEMLMGCFKATIREECFKCRNRTVETVFAYISYSVDSVILTKTVTIYPNNSRKVIKGDS